MEKRTNEKIDELAALVKESALAIKENSVAIKENAAAIDDLVTIVKAGFDQVGKDIVDVNQKVDILRTELKNDIAGVDARLSSVRLELKSEISAVRTELKSEISGLRNELHSEISSVRTEIGSLRSEMRDGFMNTNDKVDLLAVKLADKKVITKKDAEEVMALGPVLVS